MDVVRFQWIWSTKQLCPQQTAKRKQRLSWGAVGFWRIYIPDYSQTVNLPYHVTWKKNHFRWGPEQQQDFNKLNRRFFRQQPLGQSGCALQNVLYTAYGENGPSWSLWQKRSEETGEQPLGLWSWEYKVSGASYTQLKKRYCLLMKGFELLHKWLAPKHSFFWHPKYQCWDGCSKARSLQHALMLHGQALIIQQVDRKSQLPWDLGSHHELAWWWKFLTITIIIIIRWHVLRSPHHITSYQKMKIDTLSSLTVLVML